MASPDPGELVRAAEAEGFPRNCCGWVKGIYGAVRRGGVDLLVAVTQGDCSYTQALMEVLRHRGVEAHPFAYPHDRDPALLRREMEKLAARLGTTLAEGERWRERLLPVRGTVTEIDRLTWEEGKVSGGENHRWLVSCSDFEGDPARFASAAGDFLREAARRPSRRGGIPLSFAGVPPILSGIHDAFEDAGGRFVLNEVARQFSMPFPDAAELADQYLRYTYPYSVEGRIADIRAESARRGARAVVHYVQSFCFRQIEDILLREECPLPVLTLEGDQPGPVDGRTRIRIEAFLEMVG
jgi:benzoyl-CoA reductase/2-hydroxyglutaryl-CoA dehydratase subunit BcrC/BadD/HgdB